MGCREGDNGEIRGMVKSRNMYKGPMDKDNGRGGLNVGGEWIGQGRIVGRNGDNYNKTTTTNNMYQKLVRSTLTGYFVLSSGSELSVFSSHQVFSSKTG